MKSKPITSDESVDSREAVEAAIERSKDGKKAKWGRQRSTSKWGEDHKSRRVPEIEEARP